MSDSKEVKATASIAITGVLEFRDADGKIVEERPFTGSVPLEQLREDDDGSDLGE